MALTNFASGSLTLNGLRVAYHTAGDPANPPLILLHGWLMHGLGWRKTLSGLSSSHYCIAFDLPGFADSDKPDDRAVYAIPAQGRTILEAASALGLDAFALMGHSMGGQIALHMAATAPERITRLIAVAPVVSGKLGFLPRRINMPQMWLGKIAPFAVPPTVWLMRRHFFIRVMRGLSFPGSPPPVEDWAVDWQRMTSPDIVTPAYWAGRAILETDLTPLLAQIVSPTLLLTGRRDNIVPISESMLAEERIAGARVEWFDDGGHFPFSEYPQRFNEAAAAFLR